jgi:glutathione S-transferase
MMRLYGCPGTRSIRAAWALEEAGAQYEYVKVDLMKGEGRRPPFIELNPAGKVPALVEGDLVLTESAAIINHVGDRHPQSGLTPPPGTAARARYDKWCFYAVTELEQPLWTIAKHSFAIPEKYRVPQVIETAKWEFSVAVAALDRQFGERAFVLEEGFSGADILIAQTLGWARAKELPIDSGRLLAYADRVLGRAALARARAREAGVTQP